MDDEEIERLRGVVVAARCRLTEAQKALDDALVAKAGVKIGDIVRHKRLGACIVVEIEPSMWTDNKVWIKGSPRKADGTWSKVVRNLYSEWVQT